MRLLRVGLLLLVAACGSPCRGVQPGQRAAGLPLSRTEGAGGPVWGTSDPGDTVNGPAIEFFCCWLINTKGMTRPECAPHTAASCSDPKYQGVDVFGLGEPYSHVNGYDDRDLCGVVVKDDLVVASFNDHDG